MQEEKEKLLKLNYLRLLIVLTSWLFLWLVQSIQHTRPSLLIVPFTVIHITLFAVIAFVSNNVLVSFSICTLIMVGLGMSPTLINRPKAHWVN